MNVAKKERACRACVRCAKAMRRRRCVVAMALLVLVSSCRDEVAEVAVTPEVVHFADLDEATQARLRAEIEADVRAKIEAEVRAECESKWLAAGEPDDDESAVGVAIGGESVGTDVPDGGDDDIDSGMVEGERDGEGLRIMRLLLTTDVVRRLPVDARDTFTIEDGSIFCYAEISAPKDDSRTITLRFTHATGLTQSYALPVNQSPAWRTWSKLNLTRSMTGHWLCEIFNEDGVRLAHRAFDVVGSD